MEKKVPAGNKMKCFPVPAQVTTQTIQQPQDTLKCEWPIVEVQWSMPSSSRACRFVCVCVYMCVRVRVLEQMFSKSWHCKN